MRFGVWTPLPHTIRPEPEMERAIATLRTPGGGGPDASFEMAVTILQRAEALGFDASLVAERFLGPDLEAWILGAALAARTTSIELLVAMHPGIISPQVAAKMGATLDRISGGRFAVNLVNGWWAEELALFGQGALLDAPEARYARMEEFLQVLKGLWTQDRLDFDGRFYTAENGALPIRPVRRPHPPIYAASRAATGKDVVARQADVWFVNTPTGTHDFDIILPSIRAEIDDMRARADAHGRSLGFAVSAHVINEPTMEQAERKADELHEYGKRDPISAVAARALGAGLVGTPEVLAERMCRLEEAGVACFMMHFHPMLDGLERFAAQVMPLTGRVPA